ncbi:MAG TPA: beta-ketoacyl synthase N-terminal-like domain-containing protein, partial [Thermoanaerobaculia bacterium]|nr:beta-ketoacyl synthase N-terminal-like domain-containing protein [Thermoanaerobaculia bacterium]
MTEPAAAEGCYDVAVVGMAGCFPGAPDLSTLWQNLCRGVESISFFDEGELLAAGVRRETIAAPGFVAARGLVTGADLFDAPLFGFSPREARLMDPQQRLFLECAWEALGDASCDPGRVPGLVGVYAGVSQSSYLFSNLLADPDLLRAVSPMEIRLANDRDFLATLTSYRLNLKGPSVTVATACSSSLVAVHLACQALLNRETDAALAGGASLSFPQVQGYIHQQGGILSADGHCRAFDAAASGSVGGDGVGLVVLKRLADALADRDAIRAVIKGSAIGNDGAEKIGFTAPSVAGQAATIAQAQSAAGIAADSVTYIEAHGSGTPLGDPVEIRALTRAFRAGAADPERRGYCAVGSVKTNLGHLDAAAGIAGLIKTVLALEHRVIPPSLHFRRPNPAIPFAETPFFVVAEARPWEGGEGGEVGEGGNGREGGARPLRAGVNSFGIGGTNAHVVLEEAPAPRASGPSRPWQLLLLSAAGEGALERATDGLAAHLAAHPEVSLADVAHSGRIGRPALRWRRALVCKDREEAMAALGGRDASRLLSGSDAVPGRPVAFLLPGVGDHYAGMASGLYETEEVFRREVDRAAELLAPLLGADVRTALFAGSPGSGTARSAGQGGLDLRRMVRPAAGGGAADHLDHTVLAQPAVFVVDHALARLWESWGVLPRALLGYSLGEYVAACLAGVLSLEDALRVVAWRARRIAELPPGAMLAVALPAAAVTGLLGDGEGSGDGGGVSLAAVNAPGQTVVSGTPEAVAALAARLLERGVGCRRLPATHAFHSAMLAPLAAPFARFLAGVELRPPRVPYVTNVTGTWVTERQATDPEHWARHMVQPVRFAAGLAALWQEEPATCLLEVGPGHGLTTLARQQDPEGGGPGGPGAPGGMGGPGPGGMGAPGGGPPVALPSLRPVYDPRPDGAFLLDAAAKLWLAGVEIDWTAFAAGERRNRVPLPAYPFERRRYWIEPRVPLAALLAAGEGAPATGVAGAAGPPAAAPAGAGDSSSTETGEAAAAPLHPRPPLRRPFVGPRSPREERVAAIWRELLRIDAVGVHDSFFELGGNSLLAPRVLLALRLAFGIDLPLPRLLAEPTVALVARAVEELAAAAAAPTPADAAPGPTAAAGAMAAPAAAPPDLAAEVVLDAAIQGVPGGPAPPARLADPEAVLLTGATGFLGAFLLRDLLEQTRARVVCLVRAASAEQGLARVLANLARHRLALPAGAAARIVALPGDLEARRWNLSEAAFAAVAAEVEAVYHAAAWVNFTYPYAALKPANVIGTEEALRLAATARRKPLHFISTIAVFPPAALAGGVGREDADLSSPAGLAGGYP